MKSNQRIVDFVNNHTHFILFLFFTLLFLFPTKMAFSSNDDCLMCHGEQGLERADGSESSGLYVKASDYKNSVHGAASCIDCHHDAVLTNFEHKAKLADVSCATCHTDQGKIYLKSVHGTLALAGKEAAPTCESCHGTHNVLGPKDFNSPIHAMNIPELCGKCHQEGKKAAVQYSGNEHDIIEHYQMSVHGKGLIGSGLLVTATCVSCHTAHAELPAADPKSTVHADNLPTTCGNCHAGIFQKFKNSIHSPLISKTDKKLPSCKDCHSSHTILRTDENEFRQKTINQCGDCHEKVLDTYFDTYHGKVSMLGYGKTAKCSDCHGSHNILSATHPESMLNKDNIVETCRACHEGSNEGFASYLAHATHNDPEKYPAIYYTFWFMTLLLLGTMAFFGLHTLLWLPRSFREYMKKKKNPVKDDKWIQRFPAYHRVTHIMIILSFFLLVITGMALKFSCTEWAKVVANLFGGFETAGNLHRLAAIVTFAYFGMHIFSLFRERKRQGKSWISFLFGPESMVPNFRDLKEFVGSIRWFIGRGPQPEYGRWTYWEKFDYFAVFWGVAMIGFSGLILWFPEFFTLFLPGWAINVAAIIHSDEALLAAGFIFTIHFFNTHCRPDKFPMDPVIFTGRVSFEEFKHERPREYKILKESGELEKYFRQKPSLRRRRIAYIFGFSDLAVGLVLIALIIYSVFFMLHVH